jgi:cell fate (sporulation/competence/biofilm development) regulator YlbF (YheA/YmcA/DUF963 family)
MQTEEWSPIRSEKPVETMLSEPNSAYRNKIYEKVDQLAQLIQETDEWKKFKQAEQKIERHGDAQALLFVVKAKRNRYSQTSLRLGYDHPDSIQAKREYDEVLEKMAKIPLIEQYQAYQEELNELIQGVIASVVAALSESIPVERGEGTSGGGCGGCSSGGCGGCRVTTA